ncbi:hypothetical protein LN042_35340 [Kitasatospora sp. RB6PN24]|uniref:hypothetical protein n=1 Tax=Kitasatospora humi TaxID=2893891 RepID=UPI001E49C005|nr:hypothetical protein [Kitasatospora humi]MCC9312278.1 hypothetical protein [Kitasatospora humi]
MKQATLKAAGTAALAIAAVAAGTASASAATGGLSALPTGALPDTGAVTGALGHTPALGGPVAQTTGLLNQGTGQQAAAPDATAGLTRGLPLGAVSSVAKQAPGPLAGLLGGAIPVSGGLPGLGG